MQSFSYSARIRSIVAIVGLGFALAGSGLAVVPAVASEPDEKLAESSSATSGAVSSQAAEDESSDAVEQAATGQWQLIFAVEGQAGLSSTDAVNADSSAVDAGSVGSGDDTAAAGATDAFGWASASRLDAPVVNLTLDISADGTYGLGMASAALTADDIEQMGLGPAYVSGAWASEGDGLSFDEGVAFGALDSDGTLTIVCAEGDVLVFATAQDITGGTFSTLGGIEGAYLANPRELTHVWILTGVEENGTVTPVDALAACYGDAEGNLSATVGRLVLNGDGSCSLVLCAAGQTDAVAGTWEMGAEEGEARVEIPAAGLSATARIGDDGALYLEQTADQSGFSVRSVFERYSASSAADAASNANPQAMVFRALRDDTSCLGFQVTNGGELVLIGSAQADEDGEAGSGTDEDAAYVSDPDGFAHDWVLTDLASFGALVPLDAMPGMYDFSLASELAMNSDGTCTITISSAGATNVVSGTWNENADGSAHIEIPDVGQSYTAAILDGGVLYLANAASAPDAAGVVGSDNAQVYRVLMPDDSTAADGSAAADSSAGSEVSDASTDAPTASGSGASSGM